MRWKLSEVICVLHAKLDCFFVPVLLQNGQIPMGLENVPVMGRIDLKLSVSVV